MLSVIEIAEFVSYKTGVPFDETEKILDFLVEQRLEENMKTEINELEVNGVVYVPKGTTHIQYQGDTKIVILQRGWVLVGRFERTGSDCKLHQASVIRNWGTTKGLGEIAAGGPTKDTKIDPTNGLVEFDYLTVVATIACNESAWKKYV